jgi:hypothetical protein
MKLKVAEILSSNPVTSKTLNSLWAAYHPIEQVSFDSSIEDNEYGLNPDDAGEFNSEIKRAMDHLYNAITILETVK